MYNSTVQSSVNTKRRTCVNTKILTIKLHIFMKILHMEVIVITVFRTYKTFTAGHTVLNNKSILILDQK